MRRLPAPFSLMEKGSAVITAKIFLCAVSSVCIRAVRIAVVVSISVRVIWIAAVVPVCVRVIWIWDASVRCNIFLRQSVPVFLPVQLPFGSLHLFQRVQNPVQGCGIFGVAVFHRLEHAALGGAAVDLLSIRQQAVKAADDVPHLIEGVERAGHAGEGHVPVIMEAPIRKQGLVGFQVVDPFQVRGQDADHQVAGLDGGGGEHVGHGGAAVQYQVVNQAPGCGYELQRHPIVGVRVAQGVLTGTVSHQADEWVVLQHGHMACYQGRVYLHAA